jgi:Chaperone for protein-folding within the ER, fungal
MKKLTTERFQTVSPSPAGERETIHADDQAAQQPACPSAIMQWQHGTYNLEANGSLLLKPFAVDGRQVMSSPCSYDQSVYTRYSNPELMKVRAVSSAA